MGERCSWPAAFSFRVSEWQTGARLRSDAIDAEDSSSGDTGHRSQGQHASTPTINRSRSTIPNTTPQRSSNLTSAPGYTSQVQEGDRTSGNTAPARFQSLTGLSESPDALAAYCPNAQYGELHGKLYDAMVDTAKGSAGVTRQATPEQSQPSNIMQVKHIIHKREPGLSKLAPPLLAGVIAARERQLWANYIAEISTWLDMFDNQNHFRMSIPIMAQSSAPLRLSCLALSARQLERCDPNKPYVESLALYQHAIQLVTQELRFMYTPLIASCVLLCVLEMMSSSPKDWARHLDGCSLIKAAGISGESGGLEQATF